MALTTVSDILTLIDDYGFTDTSLSTKLDFINEAIADICSREPWPFLESTVTLTFDGTNATPSNFPADFRAALSLVDPSSGQVIQPYRLDTVEKEAAPMVTQTGQPLLYYFEAATLKCAPIPTANVTLRLRYLRLNPVVTDTSVSTDILIPERHRFVIVLGTLVNLYNQDDDPELAVPTMQQFESRLQKMSAEIWQRQYDRPDIVHVTDPDYYDLDF